ncbi:MAG: hypothetical protein ACP5JG_07070 [Anaerolineae bacterium]
MRLYADEIKPYRNAADVQWMYIGVLAIPESGHERALRILEGCREQSGYNGEVHFTKLKNRSDGEYGGDTRLAGLWCDRFLYDGEKVFHFHLLGLNCDNLQNLAFGTGRSQRNSIYNRFFRTSVKWALKYFFPRGRVLVSFLGHDRSNELQQDDLFGWHSIWRVESEERNISFNDREIVFISSDHRKEAMYPRESHLLQLCDVLLGGFTQCLDHRNTKSGCCEIAEKLLPLAERLTDERQARNPNSRYAHYRRVSLSFFPSKALSLADLDDDAMRARSGFYVERTLLFRGEDAEQLTLGFDMC